jgi:preprotein translocase subunit SecG
MWNAFLMVLLFFTALFLILLVLIQRGRGGGLAGAFGGLGGQSAFGTKAGDLFTRITIGVAAFWIILCATSVKLLNDEDRGHLDAGLGRDVKTAPGPAGGKSQATDSKRSAAGEKQATPAEAPPATTPPAEPAAGPPAKSSQNSSAPASTPDTTAPQGGEKSEPAK